MKTLEQRNIFNSEIGARLSELIAEATKLAPSTEIREYTTRDEAYQIKAHEFHAWLSRTARILDQDARGTTRRRWPGTIIVCRRLPEDLAATRSPSGDGYESSQASARPK